MRLSDPRRPSLLQLRDQCLTEDDALSSNADVGGGGRRQPPKCVHPCRHRPAGRGTGASDETGYPRWRGGPDAALSVWVVQQQEVTEDMINLSIPLVPSSFRHPKRCLGHLIFIGSDPATRPALLRRDDRQLGRFRFQPRGGRSRPARLPRLPPLSGSSEVSRKYAKSARSDIVREPALDLSCSTASVMRISRLVFDSSY